MTDRETPGASPLLSIPRGAVKCDHCGKTILEGEARRWIWRHFIAKHYWYCTDACARADGREPRGIERPDLTAVKTKMT